MAGAFDFSQIDLNDPFGNTARQGSVGNAIFGQPTIKSQAAGSTAAFQQRILQRLNDGSGKPFEVILLDELKTPEGIAALTQPGFLEAIKELQQSLAGPKKEFGTAAPGANIFNKATGDVSSTVPNPTAQQKLVDAIINAKSPEERRLLERGLAGTDGRPSITDYLKLRSAGVELDPKMLPRALTEPVTPEQAQIALTLGTAQGPRAPNINDLLIAAMGIDVPGSPLNGLDKEALRNALRIKEELAKAEAKPGPLDALLAGTKAGKEVLGTASAGEKPVGLDELFKTLDEAERQAGPAPVTQGAAEVPIFGSAPGVGSAAGTAAGPRGVGELAPDQLKAVEQMPPENFGQLSKETLAQITRAVIAKTLKLSEEQKAALLAANGLANASAN